MIELCWGSLLGLRTQEWFRAPDCLLLLPVSWGLGGAGIAASVA